MREIKLTKGQIALVDDADYEGLSKIKWCATLCSYAYRQGTVKPKDKYYAKNGKYGYMHRMLMNYPDGMVVDHIDGDGLNNRRENLRIITTRQNLEDGIFKNHPADDIADEDLTLEDLM